MTEQHEPRGVSRRTIAKGAAWAVPVVPMIAATPAYASSGGGPTPELGDACKLPGNSCGNVFVKGYVFDMTVCNNTNKDIWLYNEPGYAITFTEDSPAIDLFFQAAVIASTGEVVDFPYLLEANTGCVAMIFNAGENGNSQNIQNLTVTVNLPWGHTEDAGGDPDIHPPATDSVTFDSTVPVQNPSCGVVLPPNCGTGSTSG